MATTSAVQLLSPTSDGDTDFYVHYDGDDVGKELERIIGRDGYPAAFIEFADQPSRFWRHLDADTGDQLPEYITRIPENIARCRAVAGYGVLWVGDEELAASRRHTEVNLDTEGNRAYQVDGDGTVRIVR